MHAPRDVAGIGTMMLVPTLLEKGEDKILQKVGEEAVEVLLAGKGSDDDALVYELADLVFHSLVLLGARDIPPQRITTASSPGPSIFAST